MINHIYQPDGSSLCGQTCVAMIAGTTLEASIQAFEGKRGKTRTTDVVDALRKLGIKCGDRLIRLKAQLKTDVCIVKLHFEDSKNTHWTLWYKGRFYDPSKYGSMELVNGGTDYVKGVRQTSYLPIFLD